MMRFALPILLALTSPAIAQEKKEEQSGILYLVPQKPLELDPLRISSNNLLHSLFGLLPMESARVPEELRLDVGLFLDISSGDLRINNAQYFFTYDATLLETNLDFRLSIPGGWEAIAGIDVSDLLEENETDIVLARNPGVLLVPPSERGVGIGDLRLALKKSLFTFGPEGQSGTLGAIVGAKVPISTDEKDLLTSDGFDFAASALYTQDLGPLTIHVNAGAILPADADVFTEEVETRIAFTAGLAVVYAFEEWGAVIAQMQTHQSLFDDSTKSLDIVDDWVGTIHLGARFRIGSYVLELSGGTGFNDRSSDVVFTLGFSVPFTL